MSAPHEPTERPDGGQNNRTPLNSRFSEPYRRDVHGPETSRSVFLEGCGLPLAWRDQAQWRILETGFGLGMNFLVTWAAWKVDPSRPTLLHFVSIDEFPAKSEDILHTTSGDARLHLLAIQLHAQLWGLLPGFHRLVFEGGQVLLTLCIGDRKTMLRQQYFAADSVYLAGLKPAKDADNWDVHTLKAVASCCKRGTRIASWPTARSSVQALHQCGFVTQNTLELPQKNSNLQAYYDPSWKPKKPAYLTRLPNVLLELKRPATAVVVGAGLAGAAVANSLARRGWQVFLLDAASGPAGGASSLPAGLLVPHVSADDGLLSRLSRSGVRITLQQAYALLEHGTDWSHSGVLAHNVESTYAVAMSAAQASASAAADWNQTATPAQLAGARLAAASQGLWHAPAGWIKPARLVNAWISTPGITWCGNARATRLQPGPMGWEVLDASGAMLGQGEVVVLAAAHASQELAATVNQTPLTLQALRGQISWGLHKDIEHALGTDGQTANCAVCLPDLPVNGHGGLLPAVPGPDGLRWIMGASYERDCNTPVIKPQDHDQNLARLRRLLPQAAGLLADSFKAETVHAWAGVRCATPGRLPTLGRIAATRSGAEVWICTGMGSRGLSFAGLCAELLASYLHGEPLPLERRLAQAMMTDLPTELHP